MSRALDWTPQEVRALTALDTADKERLLASDVVAITGLLDRYEEALRFGGAQDFASGLVAGDALGFDTSRETVAKWMRANGFATGHGDTLEDLLNELTWQVTELRELSRNAGGATHV